METKRDIVSELHDDHFRHLVPEFLYEKVLEFFLVLPGQQHLETPFVGSRVEEFLKEDLMKHKKVFEALGAKAKVAKADNQLSGIGINLTSKPLITFRLSGKQIVNVQF